MLSGFQVAPEFAPTGAADRAYTAHVFQFSPPSPLHRKAVGRRKRLPDYQLAAALEALDPETAGNKSDQPDNLYAQLPPRLGPAFEVVRLAGNQFLVDQAGDLGDACRSQFLCRGVRPVSPEDR